MEPIKFGPGGNSKFFYESGFKHSYQESEWLNKMGLDAFEYPYGRGGKFGKETAYKIGEEARKYNIAMSIHAPYYINLNKDDNSANIKYFLETCKLAVGMNASRIVFHPGSLYSMTHKEAVRIATKNLIEVVARLNDEGFNDLLLCPETMGKRTLIGSVDDIIELCTADSRIYPGLDFGHINALTDGGLKSQKDYADILDKVKEGVDEDKYRNMHIHFSHIEYTKNGEKKHLTFADDKYGPFFETLAHELYDRKLTPVVICESDGTQAEDALTMQKIYEDVRKSADR